jgi:vacuolar-type H+-ATPase subunit H
MAKSKNESPFLNDEFTKIFDEYRAKIEEITRKTEKNLQSINVPPEVAADVPVDIDVAVETEEEQPEETAPEFETPEVEPPKVETEPDSRPVEVIWPSNKESVEIIKEAKRKAQQLISQAEENIKKEAKKKTQAQIDKIILKAKKEAEVIVARAVQTAEEVKDSTIARSKQEAEQFLREITEKCRDEAMAQSSRVVAEAQEKVEKMMEDIVTSGTEINDLISQIVNRAKNTVHEFEAKLHEETGELSRIITETQEKLEQITRIAKEEEEARPVPPPVQSEEVYTNPSLRVRLIGDKTNGKKGRHTLFQGKLEMTSASSVDYQYLRNLKKHLVLIPSIKYLQENASEKEMSILFDVKEPLPLFDVLNNIPFVEEVTTGVDGDLCIIFKHSP